MKNWSKSLLANWAISQRIMLLLALPFLGVILCGSFLVSKEWRQHKDTTHLLTLGSLAPTIGEIVHELQKERGMSAGHIASKGVKFAEALPKQRTLTDEKHAAFGAAARAFPREDYGSDFGSKLSAAETALKELDSTRKSISEMALTVPQMAKYYTDTIAKLLGIIDQMTENASSGQAANAIAGYTAFLHAKERAGLERAMGAAGFARGAFAPVVYQRFIRLIAMQDVLIARMRITATPDQIAFYAKTMAGPAVDETARMRKVAIDSQSTGNTGGIEAGAWFKTITGKINLMKTVEDRLAADLTTLLAAARADASRQFFIDLTMTIVILVVAAVFSIFIVWSITGPILDTAGVMQKLSSGDYGAEVPGLKRKDEIGVMASAVQVFKENAAKMQEMEAEKAAQERQAEEEKRAAMQKLADDFEGRVKGIVETVSSSSSELQSTAEGMSTTADQASRQASAVATASEQATTNVQTVASAAEEMSASVNEINRQVAQSAQIATKANEEAKRTNHTVQGLADAAQKIGEVVKLISDIAEQTNLLALNATIEAARAGEAGKGFAVVASEVKNLANQTASATEEISEQIAGIQSVTNDAVGAIRAIAETIGEINSISETITTAIGEQGAATQEIASNTQKAAAGTQEVSSNIASVTEAASQTGSAAQEVLGAADELSKQAAVLSNEVESFIAQVRAS